MSKEHWRQHARPVRKEIRLLEAAPTQDGFEFTGVAEGGTIHHFLVTAETLREMTGGHDSRFDLASSFERHRQRIYSVASRVFGAGVRGDPILMKIGYFGAASA